jgi:hypothetical protein
MNDGPEERPERPPSGRSSYEDFDVEVPKPMASPRRRTPTVTVAAIVVGISGLLNLLAVFGFGLGGTIAAVLLMLGLAQLVGATLLFLLQPIGRVLGFVLGAVGIVIGLVQAGSSPADGIVTIGLNGYVIYAMAVSGSSFRRG